MNELLNPDYVAGDLGALGGVADLIGNAVMWVISLVGFGIVMASIFKNAVHGLYCTNPKLFDMVNDVRNVMQEGQQKFSGDGNPVKQGAGVLLRIACWIIPDVKSLTDFTDGSRLDAKAYFIKAIPMLVVQVFLGIFIFFGYPAKVANYASDIGRGVFDVVLSNTDPAAFIEALPTKMVFLKFSTDGATDDQSKRVNEIARSASKTVMGAVSDIPKEDRNTVARAIESWIIQYCVPDFRDYVSTKQYKMQVTTSIYDFPPDISHIHGKATADGGMTFAFYKALNDGLQISTAQNLEGRYLYIALMFTPEVVESSSISAVDCKAKISGWSQSDGTYIVVLPKSAATIYSRTSGAGGFVGEHQVQINATDGTDGVTLIISGLPTGTHNSLTISNVYGLSYRVGNEEHKITDITATAGGTAGASFAPDSTRQDVSDWMYGEAPKQKPVGQGNSTGGNQTNPVPTQEAIGLGG